MGYRRVLDRTNLAKLLADYLGVSTEEARRFLDALDKLLATVNADIVQLGRNVSFDLTQKQVVVYKRVYTKECPSSGGSGGFSGG